MWPFLIKKRSISKGRTKQKRRVQMTNSISILQLSKLNDAPRPSRPLSDWSPVWTPGLLMPESLLFYGLPTIEVPLRMSRLPDQGLSIVMWGHIWANQDELVSFPFPVTQGTPGAWGCWLSCRLSVNRKAFLIASSHAGHWVQAFYGLLSPQRFLFPPFLGSGSSQRGPCYGRKSTKLKITGLEPAPYFTVCGS